MSRVLLSNKWQNNYGRNELSKRKLRRRREIVREIERERREKSRVQLEGEHFSSLEYKIWQN